MILTKENLELIAQYKFLKERRESNREQAAQLKRDLERLDVRLIDLDRELSDITARLEGQ